MFRRLDAGGNRFIPACAGNSRPACISAETSPVHPRVCGELRSPASARRPLRGSSPRVRGTPTTPTPAKGTRRFIPACAGNSRGFESRSRYQPVHPRVCGELARRRGPCAPRSRFIPACAGNSGRVRESAASKRTVHPRVCGELGWRRRLVRPDRRFIPACAGNSSCDAPDRPGAHRFIPACAGNSRYSSMAVSLLLVHPRVCGELLPADAGGGHRQRFIPACAGNSPSTGATCGHVNRFIPACAGNSGQFMKSSYGDLGSSPRVRGTRPNHLSEDVLDRFIPACAGNSHGRRTKTRHVRRFIPACAGNSHAPARWPRGQPVHPRVCGELKPKKVVEPSGGPTVHPRVCGELERYHALRERYDGSSPRVRGTRERRVRAIGDLRFIPACAGNSKRRQSRRRFRPVHPRVCGELAIWRPPASTNIGSSPRVRGTRAGARALHLGSRFIPACAGNSPPAAWSPRLAPVHPRVCGELHRTRFAFLAKLRFIPACAGNSPELLLLAHRQSVHPRVCGELRWVAYYVLLPSGSSPRVRGTLQALPRQVRSISVHPRVCGELASTVSFGIVGSGSSPRVRGTRSPLRTAGWVRSVHPRVCGELPRMTRAATCPYTVHPRVCGELGRGGPARALVDRFIPACAGNSAAGGRDSGCRSVHPRVCGELFHGLAPPHPHRRFIPACAGNSSASAALRMRAPVHPRVCGELPRVEMATGTQLGSSPRVRGTRPRREMLMAAFTGSSPRVRGTRSGTKWRRCV